MAEPRLLLTGPHDVTWALERALKEAGYATSVAPPYPGTLASMLSGHPAVHALVVGADGSTDRDLRELRDPGAHPYLRQMPVLVFCRDDQQSSLLRAGADVALTAHTAYPHIAANVHALLRRAAHRQPRVVHAGPVSIHLDTRLVLVGGREVTLPPKPYDILLTLAGDPNRVFTKQELLQSIWGIGEWGSKSTRTLETHVGRTRRALLAAGTEHDLIQTVWGVGYRLFPHR